MTRKARRKKLARQQHTKPQHDTGRTPSGWLGVGALVASTALAGSGVTIAHASELDPFSTLRWVDRPVTGRVIDSTLEDDPRLQLVHAVFEASLLAANRDLGLPQSPAGTDTPPTHRFEIPPGPFSDTIKSFATVTGLQVSLSLESIGEIQSPGVAGDWTVEQALHALVTGTGVTFRFTAPTAVVLELEARRESVEVTGRAPAAVVSSPKYTAPLHEVPQTIAVIPRAVIEEQGATTLSEALRNIPGITLQAGEGGGASNTAGDMFNMRGFNAANSLFIDNVRDDGLIARDVFNAEQVEVFMGPTGSDVGRGTAAGYVNMQTKIPHLGSSGSAFFGYGTGEQKRLTVDVDQALPLGTPGSWLSKGAVRVNALWQDSGVPGRRVVEQESRAIAPSLALGLETATRIVASAQIVDQDNIPDYGIPGAAWLDAPLTPTTVLAPRPVDQRNYYGSEGFDYDEASQQSYLTRVEHDVNQNLTLRNQTRYNKTHREAVITTIQNVAAYNPLDNLVTVARQGNDRQNKILSNQTNAIARFSTGKIGHSATAGVEYTWEEQFAPALGGLGTRAPVDIFHPNPRDPVVGYGPSRTAALTEGSTSTVGVYAFDTVSLGANWQLSGGLRWEHYDTQFRSVDALGVTTADLSANDGLLSGKAGVLFRLNESANIYLSYGSAIAPPGTANFTLSAQPNNVNNPAIEPQESTNLEAGSKWDFAGGRLSLNTAVFHTVNKNVVFTIDATAIPPIYNQDDEQRVNGVSVGAIGRLAERWEILANFAYLDATLRSQSAATNGNRLTLTPDFSGSLWTTYRLTRGLTLGGGIRHTDDVFINAANTIASPGYTLVDALAEYEVNEHLSLRVNIYNLTDETYIRNVNNNGGRYNPGNPRSAVVTSAFTF